MKSKSLHGIPASRQNHPTDRATKGYVSGLYFSETTYQLYGLDVETTPKPMKVAYIRVSSSSQSLELQREAVQKENVQKIFEEKVSGTSTQGREKLKEMLEFVREGDSVYITRTDRLARSILDLQLIVKELTDKGVSLVATEQPISTKDATSKCFLDMLGVFAEFETNIRKERQMEGIAKAKAKGVYKGGKKRIDVAEIRRLKNEGFGATKIARELNIHRDSVYRLLKEEVAV